MMVPRICKHMMCNELQRNGGSIWRLVGVLEGHKGTPPVARDQRQSGGHLAVEFWSMRVRLTRKFADSVDGVDLSRAHAGDVLNLTRAEAELLMAEDWAEPVEDRLVQVPHTPERRHLG